MQYPFRLAILCLGAFTASLVHAQSDVLVYDNALAPGWQDWSFTTRNLASTSPVHGGSNAISVTHEAGFTGLLLHAPQTLSAADYDAVRFWIHGGATGGQNIQFVLYVNGGLSDRFNIPALEANMWTEVTIPFSALGAFSTFTELSWFNDTPNAQPTYHIDDIYLVRSGTAEGEGSVDPGEIAVTVDATDERHAISPLIYGMSYADPALQTELQLPLNRWGGNATTRYNWQLGSHNTASDWYFHNYPDPVDNEAALPAGTISDHFIQDNLETNTTTVMTMPTIGFTPKSRNFDCGFPQELYPNQDAWDGWHGCGNGRIGGVEITGNDPANTSIVVDENFGIGWMQHLQSTFGSAAQGGVV